MRGMKRRHAEAVNGGRAPAGASPREFAAASAAPAGGTTPETASRAAFDARELVQAAMEEISGGRMHYMFNRVGGLVAELPAGWLGRVRDAAGRVRDALPVIGA